MPTQLEFERAADDFRRAAARLDDLFATPRRLLQLGVVVGGRFADDLRALFDHVTATFDRHADELRELESTCRARADACAAYRSEWRAYHEARDRYDGELRRWHALADAHERTPALVEQPGSPPVAPREPPPAPGWLTPDGW
jgi:hypothetical protein